MPVIYVVSPQKRKYGVLHLLFDLFLGFLTCGIWWIIVFLWRWNR